ncbi:GNAT family N-acetyltransferase [bacterium]|nr:GNAT family N-acetyltransferase [bacterium]
MVGYGGPAMEFIIKIKDINKLALTDVSAIISRLSWPDSNSDSSIQKELHKRYLKPTPGPHPQMALALIWLDETLVGWVGTRLWPEKFKGRDIVAQTIECFTDEQYRKRGIAQLGLQALITGGRIKKDKPVAVYRNSVVNIARRCDCKTVLLCPVT